MGWERMNARPDGPARLPAHTIQVRKQAAAAHESGKNALARELARMVADNNGLWSVEAESYLLEHAKPIGA